jgi:endonuclease YncB( thermonuclease family)
MRSRSVLILIALILGASAFLGLREPPVSDVGRATVIDGDSLEIGATSIRLYGVDAPEALQTCRRDGRTWSCGSAATDKLRELVGGHEITCRKMDTDSYGRTVAVCSNETVDLSAEMASAGLALAYRQYSDDYVDAEALARAERRGLWSGTFTEPWDWRRENSSESAEEPTQRMPPRPSKEPSARAPSCNIKGNINDEGERIYHLPGSRWYDNTQISRPGERWFCSEEEARREGWRAPRG